MIFILHPRLAVVIPCYKVRLNTQRAVMVDLPINECYGDETSNLHVAKIIGVFPGEHLRTFCRCIFYNYYLRDRSLASIELPLGLFLILFSLIFGSYHWPDSSRHGIPPPAGTVMVAGLPLLAGRQFVLAFPAHDIASIPMRIIQRRHMPPTAVRVPE